MQTFLDTITRQSCSLYYFIYFYIEIAHATVFLSHPVGIGTTLIRVSEICIRRLCVVPVRR